MKKPKRPGLTVSIYRAKQAAAILRKELGLGGQECPTCMKALDRLDRALGSKVKP